MVALRKEEELARQRQAKEIRLVEEKVQAAVDDTKSKTDPDDDQTSLYF